MFWLWFVRQHAAVSLRDDEEEDCQYLKQISNKEAHFRAPEEEEEEDDWHYLKQISIKEDH